MPASLSDKVIAALQRSVSLHLTAIEHYQTVAEHLARWGYAKLGERFKADADEERGHLHKLLERLEFYDFQPTYDHVAPKWPRGDVSGILAASLALETATAQAERQAVLDARSVGDERSAIVFSGNLEGSEDAIQKIEADVFVIGQVGLDNWLQGQL